MATTTSKTGGRKRRYRRLEGNPLGFVDRLGRMLMGPDGGEHAVGPAAPATPIPPFQAGPTVAARFVATSCALDWLGVAWRPMLTWLPDGAGGPLRIVIPDALARSLVDLACIEFDRSRKDRDLLDDGCTLQAVLADATIPEALIALSRSDLDQRVSGWKASCRAGRRQPVTLPESCRRRPLSLAALRSLKLRSVLVSNVDLEVIEAALRLGAQPTAVASLVGGALGASS